MNRQKPVVSHPWTPHDWSILVVILALSACSGISPSPHPVDLDAPSKAGFPKSRIDLSGVWEYQEANLIYTLMLDAAGNGTYDWQDGEFETTSVSPKKWVGIWRQPGNDREGEFEARLSPDLESATGRWWYTRIEEDHKPAQPGGTFSLMKRSTVSANGR